MVVQGKVYTREQLAVFDLLDQPVWVFDVDKKAMWWANSKAVELWNAASVDELIARDFASDMSETSAARLRDYLRQFREGNKIKDQWTFYPNGQGPVTVMTTASGIAIDEGGRLCMLVEGVSKNLMEAAAEATLNPASVDDAVVERCKKRRRTDNLLFDVFPRHVAHALREGRKVEPEAREEVTVFFADIVGFTTISASLSPIKVSDMLDRLYTQFDALSRKHGVFKVETIGDSYMAVTNLITDQPDHCQRMAAFAQASIETANATLIDPDQPQLGHVHMRIGLHAGPVVANVIGSRNPRYCLFGDTVNTASRMESSSQKNMIQCSDTVAQLLLQQTPLDNTTVRLEPRGKIDIKGKGIMEPYWIKVTVPSSFLAPVPNNCKRSRRRSSLALAHAPVRTEDFEAETPPSSCKSSKRRGSITNAVLDGIEDQEQLDDTNNAITNALRESIETDNQLQKHKPLEHESDAALVA